jgi:hypothetical protein
VEHSYLHSDFRDSGKNTGDTWSEATSAWLEATQTKIGEEGRWLTVASNRPARTLVEIVKWVAAQGIGLEDVHVARPTLEDVFIELTVKRLGE